MSSLASIWSKLKDSTPTPLRRFRPGTKSRRRHGGRISWMCSRSSKDADNVERYVIFNIRQNRYRLVTIIHYSREKEGRTTEGHIYIRSFLTHKQYDKRANWDKGIK